MESIGLAANWIPLLGKALLARKSERDREVGRIAQELLFVPRDLAPVFVEPDLQQYSPADEDAIEDEAFRTPFYGWMDKFINSTKDQNDGRRHLFILGDAGMGKTSVLAMLKLAHIYSFIPKDYRCEVMKLGSDSLWRIRDLSFKEKTVLLLDSLDEDVETFGRTKARILELLEATDLFYRVVITCRTQFFPVTDDPSFLRQDKVKIGPYRCPVKYLSLFSDEQVERYLTKKYSDDKEQVREAKDVVAHMSDLKCRPLLLTYIDDLIDEKQLRNPYQIYSVLVNAWLDRECRKKNISLNQAGLLQVCMSIAKHMTTNGMRRVAEEDLERIVTSRRDIEDLNRIDVRGRALLNRNSDGAYLFAHQSFQEFLVVQSLKDDGDAAAWSFPIATEMMTTFMRSTDFSEVNLKDANLAYANLNGARFCRVNLENSVLHGSQLNAVQLQEANLTNATLSRAKLTNANLVEAKLDNTVLDNADLQRAVLSKATMDHAKFAGANLKGVDFSGARIRNSDFKDAAIVGATFEYAHLRDVDLERAALMRANFVHAEVAYCKLAYCNLTGADFTNANLSGSDLKGADKRGAFLEGATLSRTVVENATLEIESLDDSQLEYARRSGAKLIESKKPQTVEK